MNPPPLITEVTQEHFRLLAVGKMLDLIYPNWNVDFNDPRLKEIQNVSHELVEFIKEHKIKFV